MGKAKWWVCGGCHSLNDLPANKCYKCRATKPVDARLMDDSYSEVTVDRVGITVDLSRVSELSRPDPVEKQAGAGIIEAFEPEGESAAAPAAPARELYDPYAAVPDPVRPSPAPSGPAPPLPPGQRRAPAPLREPVRRGIDALGGRREWADGSGAQTAEPEPPEPSAREARIPTSAPQPGSPTQPPGAANVPPPGHGLPPGYPPPPPPGYAPPPPGTRPPGPPVRDPLPRPPRPPGPGDPPANE